MAANNSLSSQAPLLDIQGVARRLNVSSRHIATLEKRGSIPKAIRIGRCLRWNPQSIEEFISNGGRLAGAR
jgi:predicted DNA-binding transcriptional regulator AlpA